MRRSTNKVSKMSVFWLTQRANLPRHGMCFYASKFFGNERSERYAVLVEDGKVTQAFVEPEKTAIDVSAADAVLKQI